MSDFVPYSYIPRAWNTPGADIMEIHLYHKKINGVEKINPPLTINEFLNKSRCCLLKLNASKVIIIDPKSWQNINRLSNYQPTQNGYEILNVGSLNDYVFDRAN